jgi:hypothetical protein
MTKDDSPPPREPAWAGGPPDLPGDGPAPNDAAPPPRPPRRHRLVRALAWTVGVVLLIVALLVGALAGGVH